MLVIVFMHLEAKAAKDFKEVERVREYSDREGFKHQLGEKNVGMVLSGTRMR